MMKNYFQLALPAFMAVLFKISIADDAVISGAAGNIFPVTESRVALVKQDLSITLDKGAWVVETKFRFDNKSNSNIETNPGIPTPIFNWQ